MKVICAAALRLGIPGVPASASTATVPCRGRFVVEHGGFSISGVGVRRSAIQTDLCPAGQHSVTDDDGENMSGKSGDGRNRVAHFIWFGYGYRCDGLALTPQALHGA